MEEKNWSFFNPNLAEEDPSVLIPELRSAEERDTVGGKGRRGRVATSEAPDSLVDLDEIEMPARRPRARRR